MSVKTGVNPRVDRADEDGEDRQGFQPQGDVLADFEEQLFHDGLGE
ncbi:hypothetical protein [Marilutibacter spongiae]|nr:hypothetical protein [Lysobacter spongiae]